VITMSSSEPSSNDTAEDVGAVSVDDTASAAARAARRGMHLVPDAGPRQLALEYEYDVAPGVPAIPTVPRHLHLVSDEPAVAGNLPSPAAWTAQLARAIAEVASGERPPGQLTSHVARDQLMRLATRGRAVARHPSRRGVAAPLRTVRGIRVCPVATGIVEASAVLVGAQRAQAIALRLEAAGSRWVATAVELG